jgi:hypothetical protein
LAARYVFLHKEGEENQRLDFLSERAMYFGDSKSSLNADISRHRHPQVQDLDMGSSHDYI